MSTEVLPIEDLQPYPGNPRIHDDEALDESAEENGQYRSVVARYLPDGIQLLAGHGTVEAFARRGDTEVRVEVIEVDDDGARRIVLADNGTPRRASFDDAALLALLDEAHAAGGIKGTGYDAGAHEDLMRMLGAPPSLDDLEQEHGEPGERDLWPVIRVAVPHETRAHFLAVMEHPSFEAWQEEHERFAVLMSAAEKALGELGGN